MTRGLLSLVAERPEAKPSTQRTLAAIDVGTNSIKLLVARAGDGEELEVLAREKTMVRLGRETLQTGRLPEEAMAAGVECIRRFAALARAAGAERILCVGTCAVREASNGAELAERVKKAADVDMEVISGEEEARLINRAVRSDFPATADPLLVIDIGGGSTEVIVSGGQEIPLEESLEFGAVRLSEAYVTTDPIDRRAVRELRLAVDRRVKRFAKAVRATGFRTAVGTSGTIAALADMAAASEGRPALARGHGELARKSLKHVVKQLVASTASERVKLPGLDQKRADIVTAGALLLLRLMERFGIKKLAVCDRSLREGLILDALDHAGIVVATPMATGDVRRESVRRLALRGAVEWPHAELVRDLALTLFDRTQVLHQLAGREREWLEHAALLHDIGTAIGYTRHHRHSEYLIEHAELKGFTAEEVGVIAQVARYHRKARPKKGHEGFDRLDPWLKPIVEKLAALLRLADALDRRHQQVVTGVSVSIRRSRVVLSVSAVRDADAELEMWAVGEKAGLFERVFERKVEVAPSISTAHRS